MNMQSKVTEIAPDIYRISTFHPDYAIQFNQFLIMDDEPFLMHTGFKRMFQATLEGVRSIVDPAKLRWIGFSHFESDECGALNEWLGVAPHAQAVCSFVGAMVMVNDFADRAPRSLADNEVLQTGRHRLQFLATPHVPHCWDAGLFFDETERTLLCSDLFFQPGDPEPVIESDIVGRARDAIQGSLAGPMAKDMPYTPYTNSTLERLAALEPATLAVMHGSSFRGDGRKAILDLAAVIKTILSKPEVGS
jgi:flavorubredoxin